MKGQSQRIIILGLPNFFRVGPVSTFRHIHKAMPVTFNNGTVYYYFCEHLIKFM
jgi:hypothetical protein